MVIRKLRRCEFSYYDLPDKLFHVYINSDLYFYIDSNGIFYMTTGSQNPNSVERLGGMEDVKEYLAAIV
jgi:hypothetical protein|nr:MAG TPA: hypothetical protein [Caudoviricetes sp.]